MWRSAHGARCLPYNVLLNTHPKGTACSYRGPRIPNLHGSVGTLHFTALKRQPGNTFCRNDFVVWETRLKVTKRFCIFSKIERIIQ